MASILSSPSSSKSRHYHLEVPTDDEQHQRGRKRRRSSANSPPAQVYLPRNRSDPSPDLPTYHPTISQANTAPRSRQEAAQPSAVAAAAVLNPSPKHPHKHTHHKRTPRSHQSINPKINPALSPQVAGSTRRRICSLFLHPRRGGVRVLVAQGMSCVSD
jgi:hypothetical protein